MAPASSGYAYGSRRRTAAAAEEAHEEEEDGWADEARGILREHEGRRALVDVAAASAISSESGASCILRVCIWECVARRSSCSAQEQLDGGCLRHGACAIDRSITRLCVYCTVRACDVLYTVRVNRSDMLHRCRHELRALTQPMRSNTA